MRILVVSNSPWSPCGYGTITKHILPKLVTDGHAVAMTAFFGLQGGRLVIDGVTYYPSGFAPYGIDVVHLHAADFGADIALVIVDIWPYPLDLFKRVRVVAWSPVDHTPVPGPVLERFNVSFGVWSYSKFGIEELRKMGLTSANYVPLGADCSVFRPMSERKAELRRKFQIPESAFVVGMVAANQTNFPTRKGFERIMPAIANLRRKHKDIYLYIHSFPGPEMGGVHLPKLAETFGIQDACYFTHPDIWRMGGISQAELAELYNCFDVLAAPSTGEGFGIPLVEAQACGVPVITTDFSSCTELCASGWLVEPATKIVTPIMALQAVPSVEAIYERIEYAYNNPAELERQRSVARRFAEQYDWNRVYAEYVRPALKECEERLESLSISIIERQHSFRGLDTRAAAQTATPGEQEVLEAAPRSEQKTLVTLGERTTPTTETQGGRVHAYGGQVMPARDWRRASIAEQLTTPAALSGADELNSTVLSGADELSSTALSGANELNSVAQLKAGKPSPAVPSEGK